MYMLTEFYLLCLFIMQMSFLCTKFFTCGIRYCLEIPPSRSVLELPYFNSWGIVFWLMDSMSAFSFFQTCQVQKKLFIPFFSVFPSVFLNICLEIMVDLGKLTTRVVDLNYSLLQLVEVFLLSLAKCSRIFISRWRLEYFGVKFRTI